MPPPLTVTLTNTGNVPANWHVSIPATDTVYYSPTNSQVPWATLSSTGGTLSAKGGQATATFVITPTGTSDSIGVCSVAASVPYHADVTVTGKTIAYKSSTTITYTITGNG
jgi:hypothetical protein